LLSACGLLTVFQDHVPAFTPAHHP
jgi:hypothetical protein